ncbi:MAG TPA: type II toxin-antitoxin system prevent-host-death family antitoxin [Stellaceae bacterium]|nr:type II toxin-antitoxin system prevent-host-death family antitoxin [Stellaceae bacterium]
MSRYSVAQAKNQLSELIDRALGGEGVVITRHGQPVIEFKPIRHRLRPMTDADFERLRQHRARLTPAKTDAVTLVRQMRNDEWR